MPNDPEAIAGARLRPLRAIAAGVIAELLTIVAVVITIYGRQLVAPLPPAELQQYGTRAAAVVGPVFGVLFTFFAALWIVRRSPGRYIAQALIVAAAAVVLHTLSVIGAPGGYRPVYLAADACKVIAALIAAVIARRPPTPTA